MPLPPPFDEDPVMHYDPDADDADQDQAPSAASQVKARHEDRLLGIDGVEGVGLGDGPDGDEAIVVYVRDTAVAERLPAAIEGITVRAEVTGPIEAY